MQAGAAELGEDGSTFKITRRRTMNLSSIETPQITKPSPMDSVSEAEDGDTRRAPVGRIRDKDFEFKPQTLLADRLKRIEHKRFEKVKFDKSKFRHESKQRRFNELPEKAPAP